MIRIVKNITILGLMGLTFTASNLEARGWVMVDPSDGAQLVCCTKYKKVVRHYKPIVHKKSIPCDEIPTAETLPLEPGEHLAPANVKRCISCDQKYGTIN